MAAAAAVPGFATATGWAAVGAAAPTGGPDRWLALGVSAWAGVSAGAIHLS
jgi:hypothetical protein